MGKRIKYLLLGLAAIIVPLALIYCWLAFGPTGYGQIEAQGAAALARVNARMQSDYPAARPVVATTHRETRANPASVIQTTGSLAQALTNLEIQVGQATRRMDEELEKTKLRDKNIKLWFFLDNRINRSLRYYVVPNCIIASGLLAEDKYFSSDVDGLKPKPELWPLLARATGARVWHDQPSTSTTPAEQAQVEAFESRLHQMLVAMLDATEHFLLEDGGTKTAFNVSDLTGHPLIPPRLAPLAILRAVVRRDGAKASQLLDRYQAILRIVTLRGFPESPWLAQLQPLLLVLGEQDIFPREGLVRAMEALKCMRLTPAELADLHQVDTIRLGQGVRDTLDQWQKGEVYRGNTWCYLWDGKLQRATVRSLRPVLERQIDQLLKLYADGRMDSATEDLASLQQVERLMNFQYSLRDSFESRLRSFSYWGWDLPFDLSSLETNIKDPGVAEVVRRMTLDRIHENMNGAHTNEPIEQTRLVAAVALYRHDHGRYPTRTEDLVPVSLEPDFFNAPGLGWAVAVTEPTAYITYNHDHELPEPYRGIISTCQYMNDLMAPPVNLEAFRPFITKDASFETLKQLVHAATTPPLHVVCTIRHERWPLLVATLQEKRGVNPSPEEFEGIKRLTAAGRGEKDMAVIYWFAPANPLLSEDLADLLR